MPSNEDLSLRAHIEHAAPKTARAIRMLNLEIGMTFKTKLPPAQFAAIFKREADLVRAAAAEHRAINKIAQSRTAQKHPT